MPVLPTLACLVALATLVAANESFHGAGSMMCYGDMSVTFSRAAGDGEGFLDCQPAWGSAAAPPQGIIADGADGSHWVTGGPRFRRCS